LIVIDKADVDRVLSWPLLVEALEAGHRLGRGKSGDLLLEQDDAILLNRAAWKAGYGIGLKTVTGFFHNPSRSPPLPSVQGLFVLFDHEDGRPLAVIDGAAITAWKTAADSALGSRRLSRPDARSLLMVGAGAMAKPLIRAHQSVRPGVERVQFGTGRLGAPKHSRASFGPRDSRSRSPLTCPPRSRTLTSSASPLGARRRSFGENGFGPELMSISSARSRPRCARPTTR
jgi:hypothetical protein